MPELPNKIATVFDSDQQHIGEVYAKALLGAAKAGGKIDRVSAEIQSLVLDVFDPQPNFESALANPKFPVEEKSALLDRVFGNSMDGTLLTFLKVLARRHRFGSIRAIQHAVSKLRDEIAGVVLAKVTVPSPIDASAEGELIARLKQTFQKDVRLVVSVDPSILGGLIVRVGDTVYDGSIDGQLRVLRKSAGIKAENSVREKSSGLSVGT